jgi:Tol biopolymer transport system component
VRRSTRCSAPPDRRRLTLVLAALGACLALDGSCGTARPADCGLAGTTPLPGVTARLAFACDLEPRGEYLNRDIFVASPAGSPTRRLTRDFAQDHEPTWAPRGDELAFTSTRNGRLELFTMRSDGGAVRSLTVSPAQEFEPDWSPDGRLVAFASGRGGATGPLGPKGQPASLYAVRPDGNGLVRLTRSPGYDGDPAWSPDGTRIAFVSDRSGTSDVWVVDADGGHLARLTSVDGAERPTWSPTGGRIVFGHDDSSGSSGLYVMNADGSGLGRLLSGDGREPAWSPDGSWIAFVSDRDGHPNLYVTTPDGARLVQLTHDWAPKFRPAWSRP